MNICQCVLPDQLLLGDNKSIKQYHIADSVVGKSGLQSITHTFQRDFSGQLVIIKAMGLLPVIVTPEHPILVVGSEVTWKKLENSTTTYSPYINRNANGRYYGGVRSVHKYDQRLYFSKPMWLRACDLKIKKAGKNFGHYLLLPKITGSIEIETISLVEYMKNHSKSPTELRLDEKLAWILGLFVAEGDSPRGRITFSLHEDETDLIGKVNGIMGGLGFNPKNRPKHTDKCVIVDVGSIGLSSKFAEICGRGAYNKHIPDVILYNKNTALLTAFLEGYMLGDGNQVQNGLQAVTISPILAQQLQLAYARLGKWAWISVGRKSTMGRILGRMCNFNTRYNIRIYKNGVSKKGVRLHDDGYFHTPITSITTMSHTGKVYNIATSDETYLVSNAVVHNCGHSLDEHYDGACMICTCVEFKAT